MNVTLKRMGLLCVAAACALFFPLAAAAASVTGADSLWNRAGEHYSQGQYQEALQSYEALEALGLHSAPLWYNMAGCHFKMNEVARAVLCYERALRLDPRNPDIAYNLELARSYCIDEITPVPEFFVGTWVKNLCNRLSSNLWAYTALGVLALALLFFLGFFHASGVGFRKTAFILGLFLLFISAVCGTFALWQRQLVQARSHAIVMAPVSGVKSSPDNQGKDLLVIHEGLKVEVIEEVGPWSRIKLADGRQGWVATQEIEYI